MTDIFSACWLGDRERLLVLLWWLCYSIQQLQ